MSFFLYLCELICAIVNENQQNPYNQQSQGEPMSPFVPMFDATIAKN